MKARELRELNEGDLRAREADLREQVFRLRIQKAMGTLDVPLKVRALRRDLAKVQTVLREKTGKARAGARGARPVTPATVGSPAAEK
jgi:large subunit ribosomal protein L29